MVNADRLKYPEDLTRASNAHAGKQASVGEELLGPVKRFAREKPTSALLWALGIGFVLGWRLKPW
jgi:hypothetical protein